MDVERNKLEVGREIYIVAVIISWHWGIWWRACSKIMLDTGIHCFPGSPYACPGVFALESVADSGLTGVSRGDIETLADWASTVASCSMVCIEVIRFVMY